MADTQSNIQVNIDTTQALASIKNLQRQISAFHSSMAKGGAAANAVSAQMQQTLINSINATGKFSAQIRTIKTTTESFTTALEKNKFSLGEYFRYAGGASKTFGRLFKTEHDTINKVARENVKDLQTQYIRMGRDASGAMKAIAVRPLSLDMSDLATRTQIAAQKQAILNQLLKQGSTNLLNFGKNTQWAGRQLMVGFTLPLIAVGSAASKTFMDMETQAIRFKKVYGDLFTPNAESQQALKDIQELGKEFTKYGIAVSSTVGLAAEAAAAGFKGVDLTRQTTAATRLSILGQVESQKALETTIALQNAFSMSSENLAESIDFLNAVENQTVLSLDDISTAIPKAAPIVQQLGGDVKDLAFLMTAMKEGGINASEGANALKSGLASLINPTGKANEMLLSFGINAKKIVLDNKGDLKKTVVEFATALNMLDPLNRAQAIEQMFGKFQFARLSTLFANVTKEGTQASRVLDLAGASIQDLAALSEKELGMTSESAMNKFKGAVENLKLSLIPLGEQFLKAVTPIAEFITKVLDKFNNFSDTTKKIIVVITGIVAGLGPVLLMTAGLVMNGLANMIKLFAFLKSAFNKTGQSTAMLGTEVNYMTTEQRNAAAVAASLDQVHVKLSQTFTSEASAVNALTRAYQRAIAAQSQFVPVGPPITRGPIKKFAEGKPLTVGGTGNKDSELALLMPGETVIPTKMSQKYGGLINSMIADNVPGYKRGVPTTGTAVKIPGGFAAAHFGGSSYRTGRQLLAMVEGLDTTFAIQIRKMVAEVEGGLDRVFTVFTNEVIATSTKLNEAVGRTGSGQTSPIADAKEDLIGKGAATRDIELQRQLEEAGVPIEEIRVINKKITTKIKAGFKKLGKKATVTAEELDKLVDDAYAEVAKTDSRVRAARAKMKEVTAVTDPRTDSRIAVTSDPYFKHRKSGRYYAGMERAVGTGNVPYEPKAGFKITNAMAAQIGLSSRDAAAVYKQFSDSVKVRLAGLKGDIVKFSVEFAKEAEKAGIKTGNAYKVGLDKVVTADPYLRSRDRSSPHRLAAQDGRDDAVAYTTARDRALTQAGRKPSGRKSGAATREQGPAPIGATAQPGMTVLPIVSKPTKEDLRRTRNRDRLISAKAKMSGTFGGSRGMGISTGLMIGSQFLPGKAGEVVGKASGIAFGLQALSMLPKSLKFASVGLGLLALSAKGLSILQERQRRAVSAMADVATITAQKLQTLGDFFGVAVKKLPYEVARDSSGTLSPLGATQRSQVDALRADQAFQDNFKNDISALKTATKQDATLVLNSLAIQLKGRGYASEQIKTIIQALQEEAGRRDLELEFKNIGVSTEQVIERQARVIANKITQLNSLGDLFAGTGDNLFREWEKGDPWSRKLVKDEVEAELETAAAAVFGTVQGMIGQFQLGELSAKDLYTQINILSNEINKIPSAGQVVLMDRIFKQLSPEARAAALNIKGVNTQMKVLLALSTGIISAEDKLLKVLRTATDAKVLGRAQAQLSKKMKDFFKIFEENTIADSVVDTEDYQESTEGLSTASEAYLKILGKEIDGLEAKRDAQKDANDETQRQIDLQMKLSDLANQAVLAKISGDYIKAASLGQQAQNVQMEFDQETELRKKDAEIARLKAREQAIRDGANLTKAETAKIPKVAGAKKAASGGAIRGAGTGTSDSIPAYLSNGEYVIKAKSVKKYGTETFDALNAGRFATGGQIGRSASSYVPRLKDGGNIKNGFMQRWSKSISGSPLAEMMGTAQLLRLISGQGKKGDKLGASMVPLSLLGSGFGSKIMGNLGKSAFYLPNKINQMINQRKVNSMVKSGVFHGSQPVGFRGEEYLQGTNILDGSMSTDPFHGMGFYGTTSKAEASLYASGYNSTNNWGESFGSMNQIVGAPRGKYVDFTRGPKSLKWQDYGLAKALGKSMPENLGDLMNAQGLTGGIMNRISSGRTPADIMYAKWLAFSNSAGVMTKEIPGYAGGGLVGKVLGGIGKFISKLFGGNKIVKPKPQTTIIPKLGSLSPAAMAKLTPEERAFHFASTDLAAMKTMLTSDVSSMSVPVTGVSFNPSAAESGLAYIKSGLGRIPGASSKEHTAQIWEFVQSQREALLRAKYPKADLSDVKTFNELYAKEFYGLGKDDLVKIFKGTRTTKPPGPDGSFRDWRAFADPRTLDTYFSTNPYIAAEYGSRIADVRTLGSEIPMFSMDLPVSQLRSYLGEGAVRPGNMQGSFEFPQLVDGLMLAAQTPKPYYLPTQVYGQMFPNELGKTKPKFGSLSAWPFNFANGGLIPGFGRGGIVGNVIGGIGKFIANMFGKKQIIKEVAKPSFKEKVSSKASSIMDLFRVPSTYENSISKNVEIEEVIKAVNAMDAPFYPTRMPNIIRDKTFNGGSGSYQMFGEKMTLGTKTSPRVVAHEAFHHQDQTNSFSSYKQLLRYMAGTQGMDDAVKLATYVYEGYQTKNPLLYAQVQRYLQNNHPDLYPLFRGIQEGHADGSILAMSSTIRKKLDIRDPFQVGNIYNQPTLKSLLDTTEQLGPGYEFMHDQNFIKGYLTSAAESAGPNAAQIPFSVKQKAKDWVAILKNFGVDQNTPTTSENYINLYDHVVRNNLAKGGLVKGYDKGGLVPGTGVYSGSMFIPPKYSTPYWEQYDPYTKKPFTFENDGYIHNFEQLVPPSMRKNPTSRGGFAAMFTPSVWGIGKDLQGKEVTNGVVDLPYNVGKFAYNNLLFPTALWADRLTKLAPGGRPIASTNRKQEDEWIKKAKEEGLTSVLPSMLGQQALDIAGLLPWNRFGGAIGNAGIPKATVARIAAEKAAEKAALKAYKAQNGVGPVALLQSIKSKFTPEYAKNLKLRSKFEAIKAEGKILTPEGEMARYELAISDALIASRKNNFTPLMHLKNATPEQLIAEHKALPSLIEEPFELNGKSYVFRFHKAVLDKGDTRNIEYFLNDIKTSNGIGMSDTATGFNLAEIIDPSTGMQAAVIKYDPITGHIRRRDTDPLYRMQHLSAALYNKAAEITRIRHSSSLTQAGSASAPLIGGFMSHDNIFNIPGMVSPSGPSSLTTFLQKFIPKPKKPKKSKEQELTTSDSNPADYSGSGGLTDEQWADYQARNNPSGPRLTPNTSAFADNSPEATARREAAMAGTRAREQANYDNNLPALLAAWRGNLYRTYNTYPFSPYNGMYDLADDYELEMLMQLPDYRNAPAQVPWRPNSQRPAPVTFPGKPDWNTSAATGGFLDKGKLRVPKFANGGLIKGPGTGISDSIQAGFGYAGGGSIRVSNGEYVVKASSVRDYGVKTMDAINKGTATVGTEAGGTVYNINMPVTSNNANPEIVANEVMKKLKLEVSKNNKTNKVGG